MADKNFKYRLSFEADTSKAKTQLHDLKNILNEISTRPISVKLVESAQKELQEASIAAAELQAHLQAATNVKTGTLDFTKLNKSLKESGINLADYGKKLLAIKEGGQEAFLGLADSVAAAEIPIKRTSNLLEKFWENLKKTAGWQISSNIVHGLESGLSSAYRYAENLNESLNNIRIVTGYNIEDMAEYAKQANKASKALSATTLDYTNASLIYYQQGLSNQEVLERTDVTIKMANVARTSAEDVSDQMTAVWNNFYDGSKSLEYYADVMTALGAATASSTEEISAGLNKFAAVAETVGLSYEYAASALATVTSTTRQSADIVGTAFKTLFARIQDLKLGETLDDGTTLGTYSESLAKVGIDIKNTNGEIKDMNSILDEMAIKWKSLDKDAQIALAQNVAGVRQYTQLIALMDNWDFFQQNLQTSLTASGTLDEQAKIYAESWEAARDRVTASLETIYAELINDEAFIDILNTVEGLIGLVDNLIDSFGGLNGTVSVLGTILTKVFSKQLSTSIQNLTYTLRMSTKAGREAVQKEKQNQLDNMLSIFGSSADEEKELEIKVQHEALKEYLTLQAKLVEKSSEMSEIEKTINQTLLQRVKIEGENLVKVSKAQIEAQSKYEDLLIVGRDSLIDSSQSKRYSDSFKALKNRVQISSNLSNLQSAQLSSAETLQTIKENFKNFGKTTEIGKFVKSLKEADVQGEKLKNTLGSLQKFLKIDKEKIISEMKDMVEDPQIVEASEEALREYSNTVNNTAKQYKNLDNAAKDCGNTIDKTTKKTNNWSDNLVASAEIVLTAVSALQMLDGVIDTLSDPDVSGWDKFLAVVSTTLTIVPMVATTVDSLKKMLDSLSISSAGAGVNAAGAGAGTVVLGQGAKTAAVGVGGLSAAVNSLIWPLTLVALGITAVVAALSAFSKAWDKAHITEQEYLEYTSKMLEDLKNQYQDLTAQAKNFGDAINSYDSAIKTLETLDKRTTEYADALKEANEQAENLIRTYDLYSKAEYSAEGLLVINPEELNTQQKLFESEATRVESFVEFGEILKRQAIFNQSEKEVFDNGLKIKFRDYSGLGDSRSSYTIEERDLNLIEQEKVLEFFKNIGLDRLYELNDKELFSELVDFERNNPFLINNDTLKTDNLKAIVESRETFQSLLEEEKETTKLINERLKNIIVNETQAKYGEKIVNAVIRSDGTIDTGAANLISQIITNVLSKGQEGSFLTEEKISFKGLSTALSSLEGYTGLTFIDSEEKLAKEYGKIVKGLTDTEIESLTFKDGALQDAEGNRIVDIVNKDLAAQMIYERAYLQARLNQLFGDKKGQTQGLIDSLGNFYSTSSNLYGANFANAIMASAASEKFDILDLSSTFGELSQNEKEALGQLNSEELLQTLGITEEQLKEIGWENADTFYNAFQEGLSKWTEADYLAGRDTAGESLAKNLGLDVEVFKQLRKQLYESDSAYRDNAEGANLLAIAMTRLNTGTESIYNSLEDFDYIMTEAKDDSVELAKVLTELAPALQNILNIDATQFALLPATFAADNWELIKKVISGETGALEDLRRVAAEAILSGVGVDNEKQNNFTETINKFLLANPDLIAGSEIDDESLFNLIENFVNDNKIDPEVIKAYFATRGFNIDLTGTTKSGKTTYDVQTMAATGSATLNSTTDFLQTFGKTEETRLTDLLERYKQQNLLLQKLQQEYNLLSNEVDNTWGAERIRALEEVNKNLDEQNKILERKKELAKTNLILDQDNLKTAVKGLDLGISLDFDENGVLLNQEDIVLKAIEKLDSIQGEFFKQAYRENIEEFLDFLEIYENTQMEILNFYSSIIDNSNEKLAKNYEKLTSILETNLEINRMELEEIDYYLNKISDDYYKIGEAAELTYNKFGYMKEELNEQESFYNNITLAYQKGEISQADYIEGMKNARSAIYENLEAIQELSKEMQEYYGKTLDAFGEKIDENVSRMESMTSVLDHYKNIMGILGKEQDYSRMGIILEGTAKTLKDQIEVVKAEYEFYTNEVNEKYALMEQAKAEGNQEVIDLYTKQWEQARDAMIETQDQMLSKTVEWAEAMKAITENKLSQFGEELEKALTGGVSFEDMETSLKRVNGLQEEFLTTTNKAYETEKIMRTAQNALDSSTNQVAKQKLQNFIQETKQLQNQSKLSKYELEIQQAKYDLLTAEIALRDAQEAKTTVRLKRDAQGNLGYVYTADQKKVNDALQKFEDAQNALYNVGLKGANNYSEKYQQTLKEMHATLTEINTAWLNGEIISEEEYNRKMLEAKEYYYELLGNYSSLYQVALTTDSKVVRDAWMDDHVDMTLSSQEWQEAVEKYTQLSGEAMQEWQEIVSQVEKETGLSYSEMKKNISEITKEMDKLKEIINGKNGLIDAMQSQIDMVDNVVTDYATNWIPAIIEVMTYYEKLAEKIKETIRLQSSTTPEKGEILPPVFGESPEKGKDYQAGYQAGYRQGYAEAYTGKQKTNNSNPSKWSSEYNTGFQEGYSKGYDEGTRQRQMAISSRQYKDGSEIYDFDAYSKGLKSFDTGGYTGLWGPTGKLAVLHQKEIVLNAADTSNLLASVDLLHNILQIIDIQSMTRQLSGILSSPKISNDNSQLLEQQVYIEAHFPDATDRNELEAAFNNLINKASQYANRK